MSEQNNIITEMDADDSMETWLPTGMCTCMDLNPRLSDLEVIVHALVNRVDRHYAELNSRVSHLEALAGQGGDCGCTASGERVPAGAIAFFAAGTAPAGWLPCDGRYLDKSGYAALYAAIGTLYGSSGATFRLPDMRGYFPRGWDDGAGVDPQRALGSTQGDAIRNLTARFRAATIDNFHLHDEGIVRAVNTCPPIPCGVNATWAPSGHGHTLDASRQVPVAHENRPKNIALLAMIKY